MQLKIEDVSPVEKKLVVEVPWDSVADKLGSSYRELAKQVNLKGFRKGKVPRGVLERMFGKRVRAEVASELVRESFVMAVTQHELDAVSEPRVDDELAITKGKPFAFEAVVEVKGEVAVQDYTGFELTRRPLTVEDDAVDASLEHLRREHTELLPIEDREELADHDVVAISCTGTVGDEAVDRPNFTVDLGETAHEPLPGLVAALIGLKIDTADHKISLTVPDDHGDESLAGKKAELVISVLEARRKDVPELDDEFAKDTGKGETMDEVRQALRSELEKRKVDEIEEEVRKQALDELVKRNQIPVANALVERVVQNKFRRLQMMIGVQPGQESDLFDGEMRERLSDGAEDEVRGQLLLEALAEKEEIEVKEGDVDERVTEMSQRMGQTMGRLKSEMDRDGRLENLRFQLRQEKALALLVDNATVTEKEPEPGEEPEAGEHVHGPDCDHG